MNSVWAMLAGVGSVMVIWSALMLWAVKFLVDTNRKYLDKRLELMEVEIERLRNADEAFALDLKQLVESIAEFRGQIPEKFVGRADWIRFSNQIDAKLDRQSRAIAKLAKEAA